MLTEDIETYCNWDLLAVVLVSLQIELHSSIVGPYRPPAIALELSVEPFVARSTALA
jgi:hypothetical protein